jgi:UDP-N-acetylglucosamine--N-acetylmuramyl-(pentapeptide) pyrophosphoryl-undecaprenol N-acetylglucosamine transferase
MKKIILTGGGTAGHVTPNIALVPQLKEAGYQIKYIGSKGGMETELVQKAGLDYVGISSGKLRRYFSWKNFSDPFKVLKGYFQAKKIIKKYKPDIVFSKGGFVTVPVVYAAAKYHIPVIIHESDMTPGLANRLAIKKATRVCHNFPETAKYLGEKAVHTGSPIRSELFTGNKITALDMCDFTANKPVIMVTGGSLGAEHVNQLVRLALPELLKDFQVAHLCGKGKLDESLKGTKGYAQFEYISDEMKDFFAMADVIISRAGANSICEIAALNKPNILIPLSANASRGDQILNAKSYQAQGFSEVLDEDTATKDDLIATVHKVYDNRSSYIDAMAQSTGTGGVEKIVALIKELSK